MGLGLGLGVRVRVRVRVRVGVRVRVKVKVKVKVRARARAGVSHLHAHHLGEVGALCEARLRRVSIYICIAEQTRLGSFARPGFEASVAYAHLWALSLIGGASGRLQLLPQLVQLMLQQPQQFLLLPEPPPQLRDGRACSGLGVG